MLVDWHLASPVLSSKPAAYLRSGLICPCMFPLNLILPGSRIILKAKNNMDVILLSHQRGVDPCRSAWRIYRPSAKVPRLSSSTSSCEGWRTGRRGSLGNVAAKATASTQTAEKLTHQEEDEGAQRLGVGNEESWQRRKTSCLVMWGLGLREPSLGARAAEGVRV